MSFDRQKGVRKVTGRWQLMAGRRTETSIKQKFILSYCWYFTDLTNIIEGNISQSRTKQHLIIPIIIIIVPHMLIILIHVHILRPANKKQCQEIIISLIDLTFLLLTSKIIQEYSNNVSTEINNSRNLLQCVRRTVKVSISFLSPKMNNSWKNPQNNRRKFSVTMRSRCCC